jgi:hypothetical protein
MGITDDVDMILHKIKIKLYPNYLKNVKGAYIARTDNEKTLNIEEVCNAMVTRGGSTRRYEDLVNDVKAFLDEMVYQLCDGYAVSTGWFSIHPNIGGSFNSVNEPRDCGKHPVDFRFESLACLKRLAEGIEFDITGLAEVHGYIGRFIDIKTGEINHAISPGGQFIMYGHKLKVAGEDPACGVYFISQDEEGLEVKAAGRLVTNIPTQLIGIIPDLKAGNWKTVVKTQYTGSGSTSLKAARTLESNFTLTVPNPTDSLTGKV